MAKWTLPEGKLYTQAELDQRLAAALREAAEVAKAWWSPTMSQGCEQAQTILALIPDAGAALDRALADQREKDAKVADLHVDGEDSYGPDFDAGWEAAAFAIAAAIRAQGDKT